MQPISELIQIINERSKNVDDAYAYQAGYYEMLLVHLARDIPEVSEYIGRRVEYLNSKKVA